MSRFFFTIHLSFFIIVAVMIAVGCGKDISVTITSEPSGATVWIDGVEVGVTPFHGRFKKAISYHVMVNKLGYQAATSTFQGDRNTWVPPGFHLTPIDLSDMVFIPAGPFLMGSSDEEAQQVIRQLGGAEILEDITYKANSSPQSREVTEDIQWFQAEKPQREVFVDAFYIDKYEVTNAQYKTFIDATEHRPPRHWENNTYPVEEDNLPVVYVSWKDAVTYCRWVGKRLPIEEEWEKAARGVDAHIWPWGNEFDIKKCNVESWEGSGPKPVGSYPQGVSPYGVYDMAGNVWEWTDGWYDAYPGSVYTSPEFGQKFRVARGGSWYHYDSLGPIGARCASRDRGTEDHISYVVGFRCAIGKGQ